MTPIIPLLKHQINEKLAIIITIRGTYDKNFYEGVLIDVNDKFITLEISQEQILEFDYDHFILATPLDRYH